jgi:hypothetical protein
MRYASCDTTSGHWPDLSAGSAATERLLRSLPSQEVLCDESIKQQFSRVNLAPFMAEMITAWDKPVPSH